MTKSLNTLQIGSRFYVEFSNGKRLYATLLAINDSSATVKVERNKTTKLTTHDGKDVEFGRSTQVEHWSTETEVNEVAEVGG